MPGFDLRDIEQIVQQAKQSLANQRDADLLQVTAVWPERGVKWSAARIRKLESELQRVARFAGLSQVAFADNWLREAV